MRIMFENLSMQLEWQTMHCRSKIVDLAFKTPEYLSNHVLMPVVELICSLTGDNETVSSFV